METSAEKAWCLYIKDYKTQIHDLAVKRKLPPSSGSPS